jgi:hypothetical protein
LIACPRNQARAHKHASAENVGDHILNPCNPAVS